MRILIVLLFPIILLGQINTVCLNIEPNPNSTNLALSGFTKYINVLGELTVIKNNNILLYLYYDGTVEKKIILE